MEQRKSVQSRVLCALLALVLACGLLPAWGGVQQAYASETITLNVGTVELTSADQTEVTIPVNVSFESESLACNSLSLKFKYDNSVLCFKSADLTGIGIQKGTETITGGWTDGYVTCKASSPFTLTPGAINLTFDVISPAASTMKVADSTVTSNIKDSNNTKQTLNRVAGGTTYSGESATIHTLTYTNENGVQATFSVAQGKKLIVDGVESTVTDDVTVATPAESPAGYSSIKGYNLSYKNNAYVLTPTGTPISYNITYQGVLAPYDNLSNYIADVSKTYTIESKDITLPTLEVKMGTFNGWKDETGKTVTTIPAGSYGDKTFTADITYDTCDTSWYNASDARFTISTPAQLYGLARIVMGTADGITQDSFEGKTITLGANIDVSSSDWCGIGYAGSLGGTYTPFKGTFDGAFHTVTYAQTIDSVMRYGGGLFGSVSGATIENLFVQGTVSSKVSATSTSCWVGGVAGNATGSSTFSQVACSVNIAGSENSPEAVIAAGIANFSTAAIFDKCVYSGTMTNVKGSGIHEGAAEKVTNCVVNGSLSYSGASTVGCAGISQSASGTYENCVVVASIEKGAPVFLAGTAGDATITDVFYLDSLGTSSYGTSKTADDLKSIATLEALGDAFVAGSDGYPALVWIESIPSVSLSSEAANLKVGQEFTVNVNMENITAAAQATLEYSDTLELVKVEAGSALNGNELSFNNVAGNPLFSFVANEGTTDGTVAVATFKCKSAGNASVGLKDVVASASGNLSDEAAAIDAPETWTANVGLAGITGDVNNSGKLNIVDAQIVYDMGNNQYAEGSDARTSLLARWGTGATYAMVEAIANVNSDDKVDSADAFAIQYAIHYGKFPPAEPAA